MEVIMDIQYWVAVTQLASNVVVVLSAFGIFLAWRQWQTAKGIQKEHIEDLTDEIMFFANYYDNKLNAQGYVQRRKPIPTEEGDIPHIRKAIRDCLIREVK